VIYSVFGVRLIGSRRLVDCGLLSGRKPCRRIGEGKSRIGFGEVVDMLL
jgi:hypothetical protein